VGGRDVSVNHSRTGAVKLLITRRDDQSSKLLRVTVRRIQPVPAAATGLRSSPRSKRMTRPCARVLCSPSCLRGQCGSRCGNPGRPGRADVARPGLFRRSQLCTPVLASATAPAISGALSTRPQRRRRPLAGFKEVSYYHRVTPCGPE